MKRQNSYDAIAGLLMFIVMLLHFGFLNSEPYSLMHIFSFFMPWFFFKSGMFHKKETKLDKATILKLAKRLLIPLLIFVLISDIYSLALKVSNDPSSLSANLHTLLFHPFDFTENVNPTLWFLLAFLVCNILFIFIAKLQNKCIICITIILFVVLDFLTTNEIKTWHTFYNILMGLIYYSLGYLLKNIDYKKWQIGILFVLFILCIIIYPSKIDMRFNYLMYGCFEVAVIGCILGIILINYLFNKLPILQIKPLVYIGRNSMAYYLLHFPISWVTVHTISRFGFNMSYINLIACLIIIPIIIETLKRTNMGWVLGMPKTDKRGFPSNSRNTSIFARKLK